MGSNISNRVNENINLNLDILELLKGLFVENRRKLQEDVEILSSKFCHFAYFNIASPWGCFFQQAARFCQNQRE